MFVTFDPEDGSDKMTWEFDPDDLRASEAKAIEKAFGGGQDQFIQSVQIKDTKARSVLLWHCMRQRAGGLQYKDMIDFRMRQLKVELSVKEIREQIARFSKMKLDDDTREKLELAFDVDLREAMERETGVVDGDLIDEAGTEIDLPKQA